MAKPCFCLAGRQSDLAWQWNRVQMDVGAALLEGENRFGELWGGLGYRYENRK